MADVAFEDFGPTLDRWVQDQHREWKNVWTDQKRFLDKSVEIITEFEKKRIEAYTNERR